MLSLQNDTVVDAVVRFSKRFSKIKAFSLLFKIKCRYYIYIKIYTQRIVKKPFVRVNYYF